MATATHLSHRSPSVESTHSQATRFLLYGLLGLLTLAMVGAGGAKVTQADFMVANMAALHFGTVATVTIGTLQLLAAVGLWTRRYRTLALAVFLLILAGGAGAHLGFGHGADKIVPPFVLAAITFATMWLDRGRAFWDFILRR